MTLDDFVLLVTGIGIGAQAMGVMHMADAARTARRAQSDAHQALRRTAGDLYLSSLRLYRIQHRSRA